MIAIPQLSLDDYYAFVRQFLLAAESDETRPYIDDPATDMATVGRGFALEFDDFVQQAVFDAMNIGNLGLFVNATNRATLESMELNYVRQLREAFKSNHTTATLRDALDAIMFERSKKTEFAVYAAITSRPTFTMSIGEIETAYRQIVGEYERRVREQVGELGPSREKAALVSLSYVGLLYQDRTALQQAIFTDDDRAEAWYVIRYGILTNYAVRKPAQYATNRNGYATRLYYTAELFGRDKGSGLVYCINLAFGALAKLPEFRERSSRTETARLQTEGSG